MPRKPEKTTAKRKSAIDTSGFSCSFPGCVEAGDYKAPLSPKELSQYRWLCLDHVREYNANWDYFSDMHASQIEDFMKSALLGERPTWQINQHKMTTEKLEEALHAMLSGNRQAFREQKRRAKLAAKKSEAEHKALAVLDLNVEATLQDIKKQYKLLVKKHHPDVNRGEKKAEERFKRITEAYQDLIRIRKAT